MSTELLISALALVVAVVAAAAAIAGLNDEGRARLMSWSKKAAGGVLRIGTIFYAVAAILNGALGVAVFGLASTPPTRKDVLLLLLFLLNIYIGVTVFRKLPPSKNKAPSVSDQESAKQPP